MKIRTRLLISLLPAFAIALILAVFSSHTPNALLNIALPIFSAAISLYLMAGKIIRPIKTLNDSALEIAAGQYGKSIQLKGPKELGELANTLNTMSECLLEHINSLKENALQNERSYCETAYARLLQQHLLQKSIDECASDAIAIKAISFPSASPKGLLLNYPGKQDRFALHLLEAKEEGIDGMVSLYKEQPGKSLSLYLDEGVLHAKAKGFPFPFLWSHADEELFSLKIGSLPIQPGDYVFLMNQALLAFFKSPARISQLLAKVLNVFKDEGLDTCAAMLHKEIAFLAKRRDLEEDLHLICIQILSQ